MHMPPPRPTSKKASGHRFRSVEFASWMSLLLQLERGTLEMRRNTLLIITLELERRQMKGTESEM